MLVLSLLGIISFSLGKPRGSVSNSTTGNKEELGTNEVLIKDLISKVNSLNTDTANEDVKKELSDIKRELARISGSNIAKKSTEGTTLGDTTNVEDISKLLEDIPYGFITIANSSISELDVLESAAFSARRIGTLTKGENYEFFEKKDGWYMVKLADGLLGWVNERDVKEVYQ
jgi:hypothetical protein